MPKATFFNLPLEKREMILKAAKLEFSRALLDEASIANIIKQAEIPRGSFYQYFDGKLDLFMYLVDEGQRLGTEKLLGYLKQYQGDMILANEALFESILELMEEEENRQFYKNMCLSINQKVRDEITPDIKHRRFKDELKQVFSKVDHSLLYDIDSDKELSYVFKMLHGILFQNLTNYLRGDCLKEECLESYFFQMNLMKKALYKANK